MTLEVITPEKTIYISEDAASVICPGMNGTFQLLNAHAPLVSALRKGIVTIKDNQGIKTEVKIQSGLVECANNKVNILIEEALD